MKQVNSAAWRSVDGCNQLARDLSYRQIPFEISEKPGICHVRRPVSRDRRILVMEMEMGYVAYLQLIF